VWRSLHPARQCHLQRLEQDVDMGTGVESRPSAMNSMSEPNELQCVNGNVLIDVHDLLVLTKYIRARKVSRDSRSMVADLNSPTGL